MDKIWRVWYTAGSNSPYKEVIVAYSGSVYVWAESIEDAIGAVKERLSYFDYDKAFEIHIRKAKEMEVKSKDENRKERKDY